MSNTLIMAKDIKVGQAFIWQEYDDVLVLIVDSINDSHDAMGEWYDYDKADTLDTISGDTIVLCCVTLDGVSEWISVRPSELLTIVEVG